MAVKFSKSAAQESQLVLRDRSLFLMQIPFAVYGHLIAWISEYISTTFFLFLALAGEQVAWMATSESTLFGSTSVDQLLFASIGEGVAFAVCSCAFFRITSGLFNPAITIGMCLLGSISWLRGSLVVTAQFLGALTAAGIVDALLPGPMMPQLLLSDATSTARGFFIELMLTAIFVFFVFTLGAEKHKGMLLAPMALGLAWFVVEMCGIMFTGGSLNPARAFAVSIVTHSFPHYHWIYWLGPVLGSGISVAFHALNRQLEVETADAKHRRSGTPPAVPEKPITNRDTAGTRLSAVQEQDLEKGESESAEGK